MAKERLVTLREYVQEALKNAVYEKGEVLDVVVAEVPDLPGCFAQGRNFEEAREDLIDAIELWVLSALIDGDEIPAINGCRLAVAVHRGKERGRTKQTAKAHIKARVDQQTASVGF
ncbi:HicB_like antitoxin of toxin-antitoxin system [Candidatus Fervidibacteria bacterium JGI MDM2 JNZ-1-D12]